MQKPIKLLIHGATGRMGQSLIRLAQDHPNLIIAAASGRADIGRMDTLPEFDIAVDFSSPEGFDAILSLCLTRGKGLLSGSTGLSESQFASLNDAGSKIPVLWASNFSLGVAVLNRLVSLAGDVLPGWQIDIIESHHVHKKDAPSGTALSLWTDRGSRQRPAADIPFFALWRCSGRAQCSVYRHRRTHRISTPCHQSGHLCPGCLVCRGETRRQGEWRV